jgi:hypothetical protein
MDSTTGVLLVGGIAVGAYFVINAVSQPTQQTGSFCNGDWTDYFNPLCWVSALGASSSNTIDTATNEANTVLIIVAVVVVLVVGLLAFGTQTPHIAKAVSPAFL